MASPSSGKAAISGLGPQVVPMKIVQQQAWVWLGGPRVLGRTGSVLAWGAKGPGPGRLGRLDTAFIFRLDNSIIFRLATAIIFA